MFDKSLFSIKTQHKIIQNLLTIIRMSIRKKNVQKEVTSSQKIKKLLKKTKIFEFHNTNPLRVFPTTFCEVLSNYDM